MIPPGRRRLLRSFKETALVQCLDASLCMISFMCDLGMINDQTGDSTVAIVVDSSLRMVDTFVCQTLFALGVVPEDVCRHRMNSRPQ